MLTWDRVTAGHEIESEAGFIVDMGRVPAGHEIESEAGFIVDMGRVTAGHEIESEVGFSKKWPSNFSFDLVTRRNLS